MTLVWFILMSDSYARCSTLLFAFLMRFRSGVLLWYCTLLVRTAYSDGAALALVSYSVVENFTNPTLVKIQVSWSRWAESYTHVAQTALSNRSCWHIRLRLVILHSTAPRLKSGHVWFVFRTALTPWLLWLWSGNLATDMGVSNLNCFGLEADIEV